MPLSPFAHDLDLLRRTINQFPTGVAALAVEVGAVREGMIVSTFQVGISMNPPLVLFSVQNGSTTWPLLRESKRIGVSILGEGMGAAARQLSSRTKDRRFAGLSTETSESGAVFVHGSSIWLECSVRSENSAGDHHVVLLTVEQLFADADVSPLIYHGQAFRQLADLT